MAGGDFYGKALALPRGAKIGPSASAEFSSFFPLVEGTNSHGSFYPRGYWGGNKYLGVRFQLNGQGKLITLRAGAYPKAVSLSLAADHRFR